jgi:hypothetical protein
MRVRICSCGRVGEEASGQVLPDTWLCEDCADQWEQRWLLARVIWERAWELCTDRCWDAADPVLVKSLALLSLPPPGAPEWKGRWWS